jgi:hypothetical protein
MQNKLIAVVSAILLTASVALAAPGIAVHLSIDEHALLPGTPTGLSVTVQNIGTDKIELPQSLWIVATDSTGKTFVVRSHRVFSETAGQEIVGERVVTPKGSRELRYDPSAVVAGSPWFMDDRLWEPGRYSLRAILANNVDAAGTYDPAAAFVSNEETIDIGTSTTEDAAVWEWMRQHGWNEQAWLTRPSQLRDFVIRNHPESAYMLYVAAFFPMQVQDEPSAMFVEQIRRFPNKSFTDQLRLLLIHYRQQTSYVAYRHGDITRATYDADDARSIASSLSKNSRSLNVRKQAAEKLAQLPTRRQMMENPRVR